MRTAALATVLVALSSQTLAASWASRYELTGRLERSTRGVLIRRKAGALSKMLLQLVNCPSTLL